MTRMLSRAAVGTVLGLVLGVLVVAVHGRWWSLALGVAATLSMVRALPAGAPRVGLAAGLAALVAAATRTRPEGDYLVAADARGLLLEALVAVVLVVALVTLPAPRRSRLPGEPGSTP